MLNAEKFDVIAHNNAKQKIHVCCEHRKLSIALDLTALYYLLAALADSLTRCAAALATQGRLQRGLEGWRAQGCCDC